MNDIIKAIENEQLKSDITDFNVGDTVKVYAKVIEGSRERIQVYELPAPPQDCGKNSSALTADRPPNVQTCSSAQNRTQTAPGRQFRGIPASGCPDDFLPCFHSPFRLPIFQYTHIPHFCLFLTQICFHTKIKKPLTTLSFVRRAY